MRLERRGRRRKAAGQESLGLCLRSESPGRCGGGGRRPMGGGRPRAQTAALSGQARALACDLSRKPQRISGRPQLESVGCCTAHPRKGSSLSKGSLHRHLCASLTPARGQLKALKRSEEDQILWLPRLRPRLRPGKCVETYRLQKETGTAW